MPVDYSLTALEDPADVNSPLEPGQGRITQPSGDTRTFQFQPPSPEDRLASFQATSARLNAFDEARRGFLQQQEDQQYLDNLLQNARVEDAAKAVELASRFQAMRKFERDLAAGKASGLSPEQATVQAAAINPLAFGGGTGAAAVMRAIQPAPQPTFGMTPSGARYVQTGRAVQFEPQPRAAAVEKPPITLGQRLNYWKEKADALFAAAPGSPEEAELKEAREQLANAEAEAKAAGVSPAAAGGIRVKRKSDGKTFVYRGVAADVPTDRFEVLP